MYGLGTLNPLAKQVARNITGRDTSVRWDENPPAEGAVGQIFRLGDGLLLFVGYLTGIETTYRVFVHECIHGKYDYDIIPEFTGNYQKPAVSIKRTGQERQEWRENPREIRTQQKTEELLAYAERKKYHYWRVGRSDMECRLLALLDWEG